MRHIHPCPLVVVVAHPAFEPLCVAQRRQIVEAQGPFIDNGARLGLTNDECVVDMRLVGVGRQCAKVAYHRVCAVF